MTLLEPFYETMPLRICRWKISKESICFTVWKFLYFSHSAEILEIYFRIKKIVISTLFKITYLERTLVSRNFYKLVYISVISLYSVSTTHFRWNNFFISWKHCCCPHFFLWTSKIWYDWFHGKLVAKTILNFHTVYLELNVTKERKHLLLFYKPTTPRIMTNFTDF